MKRRTFIQQSAAVLALATTSGVSSCLNGDKIKTAPFLIEQFEDKGLAQFSYAILVDKEVVLVDPARDPKPYYSFADKHGAKIVAVIETHPHADFVSSHVQVQREKHANIYVSPAANVSYTALPFGGGADITLGNNVTLRAIDTPGHSPDSISVLLRLDGKDIAVFSGDALLLGGVGRPDLREYSGEAAAQREVLARQMYHSIHQVYALLDDEVIVYPAHGAGSLCANALSEAKQSTIAHEKKHNFAFQQRSEEEFTQILLADRPPIPAYFPYDVALNKKGAGDLDAALNAIPLVGIEQLNLAGKYIVDVRSADLFRASHLSAAINIPDRLRMENWLGTIVAPVQQFYLVVAQQADVAPILAKAAKIGYESLVQGVVVFKDRQAVVSERFDAKRFDANQQEYFILDVRSHKEAQDAKVFSQAVNIPLTDLALKIDSLPTDRPIAIHCATGYRSAIAASLIKKHRPSARVVDIGGDIARYAKQKDEKVN